MYLRWIIETTLLIISSLTSSYANKCQFKRYLSATLTGDMTRGNATIFFEDLETAKDACNLFKDQCNGISMRINNQNRNYILTLSNQPLYFSGRIAWIKFCEGDCFYSRVTDFLKGKTYFRKICPAEPTLDIKKIWGRWLQWGSCSQSCGKLGEQKRFRSCIMRATNQACKEQSFQTRVCNYEKKCPGTISGVFGIHGTEGFQHHGNTPVYSTCIRTELSERKSCVFSAETISRNTCTQQLKCCYLNDSVYEQLGNPRCFEPKHFIASTGFIEWSVWSVWTPCSASCGKGTRIRNRICTGSMPNYKACQGKSTETKVCDYGVCPCDTNPCHNGGICRLDKHMTSGYKCDCTQNFIGRHCDFGEPQLLCGNDSIIVTFDRGLIEDQGLIDDWRYIHFQGYESASCFAHLNPEGTRYLLSVPPPIDQSCGSYMLVTDEEYVIRNKVLWRLTDESASSTVALLDLTCTYNKKVNMTANLDFAIRPTVRTLSFQTLRSEFHVSMALYRKPDFSASSVIRTSPTVAQGEVLYVSVNLKVLSLAHPENEVLVLDRCYAADTTENQQPIYEFIHNGCATNSIFTTVLANGVSAISRWAFRVFQWTSGSMTNEINIVCKVFVCDTEFEKCRPSCDETVMVTPSLNVDGNNSAIAQNFQNDSNETGFRLTGTTFRRQKRQLAYKMKSRRNRKSKIFSEFHHMTISKRIQSGWLSEQGLERNPQSELSSKFNQAPAFHRSLITATSPNDVLCSWPIFLFVAVGSIALYVGLKFIADKLFLSRYWKS